MKKKGISLIVLVITIIVMVILAAAVVITLSNTGIINRANVAVKKTNMKQIEQLASLAWSEAFMEGARTQEELQAAVDNALKDVDTNGITITVTTTGVTVTEGTQPEPEPELNEYGFYYDQPYELDEGNAVVYLYPDNTVEMAYVYWISIQYASGTYSVDGNTITVNVLGFEEKVCEIQEDGKTIYIPDDDQTYIMNANDSTMYIEGDYMYYYDVYDKGEGFCAFVKDKTQTTYGKILSHINGRPVTSLEYTFSDCTNLTVAPEIPNTITNMDNAFEECTSLTVAPIIPMGVTTMRETFEWCENLTTAPVLPSSVTDIYGLFDECKSLRTYTGSKDADGDFGNYIIPAGVTTMEDTFRHCEKLTIAPLIPANVTNIVSLFAECTSLKSYKGSKDADGDFSGYVLPNVLTDMNSSFYGCTAITVAPVIPNSVTSMPWAFKNCTSLTTAPVIPTGVKGITSAFENCSELTGEIEVNSTELTSYTLCFAGTVKPIMLKGTSTQLSELAATATNSNVTVQ